MRAADADLRKLKQQLLDEQQLSKSLTSTDNHKAIGSDDETPPVVPTEPHANTTEAGEAGPAPIPQQSTATAANAESDQIINEPAITHPATSTATTNHDMNPDSLMNSAEDGGLLATPPVSVTALEDVTMREETDPAANKGAEQPEEESTGDPPNPSTESTSDSKGKGKKRFVKADEVINKPEDESGVKKAKVDEPKARSTL
jgi:hypothetical protein